MCPQSRCYSSTTDLQSQRLTDRQSRGPTINFATRPQVPSAPGHRGGNFHVNDLRPKRQPGDRGSTAGRKNQRLVTGSLHGGGCALLFAGAQGNHGATTPAAGQLGAERAVAPGNVDEFLQFR